MICHGRNFATTVKPASSGLLPRAIKTKKVPCGTKGLMVTRIGQHNQKPRRIYLREWRHYRRMTLEQLAERVDGSIASLSRVETGQRDYTGRLLEACADALGCEPHDLIGRDPNEPSRLDDILRGQSPATIARVRAVITALLSPS